MQFLGRVCRSAGRLDLARQHYLDELSVVRELVALRDLSIVEENLGDLALQTGDRDDAGKHYRASRAAMQ